MKDRLEEAADRWGTPIYVTDVDAALANAERWRRAYPDALIAYAVKANPDPALQAHLLRDEPRAVVPGRRSVLGGRQ